MDDSKIFKRREDTQKRDSSLTDTTQQVKSFTPPPTGIDPIPVQKSSNPIQLMQELPVEDRPDYFKPNYIQQLQTLPEEQMPERFQPDLLQRIQRNKVEENGKVIQKKDDSDKKETNGIEEDKNAKTDDQINRATETKSEIISRSETIDENGEVYINISARITITTKETHTPENLLPPPSKANNTIKSPPAKIKVGNTSLYYNPKFKPPENPYKLNLPPVQTPKYPSIGDILREALAKQSSNKSTIKPVLSPSQFHGYKPTDKVGCFRRSAEMAGEAGETPVSIADSSVVQATKNVNGVLTIQPNIKSGVDLIDKTLESGKPIVIGVNHSPGHTGNLDKTTDHWIIIVGRGMTEEGHVYYRYYDPQTKHQSIGTSEDNKLFLQADNTLTGVYRKGSSSEKNYTVTVVRPNKKKE